MSSLTKLINELCPNGIEYRRLIELGNFFGGLTGKSKEDFKNGNANFISYVNVFNNPAIRLDLDDKVKIGPDEKQRKLEYCDVIFTGSSETPEECAFSSVVTEIPENDYYLNSFCFIWRINDKTRFNPHFLKHLFRSEDLRKQLVKTASGVTRFNVSKKLMEDVVIPVPPLPIQEEIVRILDNFTELTAELTAELQDRKKQYEHYRDNLLLSKYSEFIKLKELFDTRNGYTPSKSNKEYWENGTLPWFRLEDINDKGRVLFESYQHITPLALKKNGLFKQNSIIISTSATIGEYALIKVPFLCNQRFTCLTIKECYKHQFSIEFLNHYCPILSQYCKEHLNQGNFASVDMTKFGEFEFPILPLSEQEYIVSILDKFEKYCNDISDGLPAEIKLRQKQYEYYRDKLLTFKRAN